MCFAHFMVRRSTTHRGERRAAEHPALVRGEPVLVAEWTIVNAYTLSFAGARHRAGRRTSGAGSCS